MNVAINGRSSWSWIAACAQTSLGPVFLTSVRGFKGGMWGDELLSFGLDKSGSLISLIF